MFVQKKLIIVHGVPKENDPAYKISASVQKSVEERLMSVWETIPADHVMVLVCHKPDKRTKGRKFFEKNTTVKSFAPLSDNKAGKRIESEL